MTLSEPGVEQIAALRERIRRAGRSTERLRIWLVMPAMFVPAIYVVVWLAGACLSGPQDDRGPRCVSGAAVCAALSELVATIRAGTTLTALI